MTDDSSDIPTLQPDETSIIAHRGFHQSQRNDTFSNIARVARPASHRGQRAPSPSSTERSARSSVSLGASLVARACQVTVMVCVAVAAAQIRLPAGTTRSVTRLARSRTATGAAFSAGALGQARSAIPRIVGQVERHRPVPFGLEVLHDDRTADQRLGPLRVHRRGASALRAQVPGVPRLLPRHPWSIRPRQRPPSTARKSSCS